MKFLILAGGSGTRLWPLSRENNPKQVTTPFGGASLLQQTFNRLKTMAKPSDIFVVAGLTEKKKILEELPKLDAKNVFFEPARKGTTAAIAFAAHVIAKQFPDEPLVVISSDTYITDLKAYAHALRSACQAVIENPKHLVLLGAEPTYGETGYGYIKKGERVWKADGTATAHTVLGFTAKPDQETADSYSKSGQYLWNTGTFIARASHFVALIAQHAPQLAAIFKSSPVQMRARFLKLNVPSFDPCVLEHEDRLLLIPVSCGWIDVGTWRAITTIAAAEGSAKKSGNKNKKTAHFQLDENASNNFVMGPNKKLIALVGVHNLVIIDTPDALLITTPEASSDVKKIVATLKKKRTYDAFI